MGGLGLLDAATKFDPDKQVAFSSYARHRIKGAILDSLRELDWASRDVRRRHKQLEAATQELQATLQRTPTEAESRSRAGSGYRSLAQNDGGPVHGRVDLGLPPHPRSR
jgi:RNA polymerase sigma factor for flagellar operon FliA